jgi:hypothetical protein
MIKYCTVWVAENVFTIQNCTIVAYCTPLAKLVGLYLCICYIKYLTITCMHILCTCTYSLLIKMLFFNCQSKSSLFLLLSVKKKLTIVCKNVIKCLILEDFTMEEYNFWMRSSRVVRASGC